MPFTPRSRATIRDALLADWSARYPADQPLLTIPGSHPYRLAEALALILEAQESQADSNAKNILPDQADEPSLLRHGTVEGVARDPATNAVVAVEISGTAAATCTFGTSYLTSTTGEVYTPSAAADGTGTSAVFDGSGKATIYATAQTAGADGTLAEGATLTWSAAPASTNATGQVVAGGVAGEDEEDLDAYAGRIIARRQARPASGNVADWREWATDVTGVGAACVYPLLHPTYGADTLGAVTAIPLGPDQGDSPTNTRIVSGDVLAMVAGYIEGENDASGATTGVELEQLRTVAMRAGDYAIEAALESESDLELQLVLAAAYAPPWTYNAGYVVLASPTGTSFELAGNLESVLKPGGIIQPILLKAKNGGVRTIRGDYYAVTPSDVTYDGATNTEVTFAALDGGAVPIVGSVVLPPPVCWAEIRTALFAYYDGLGPGDTSPPCRFPLEETALRATLYRAALVASLVQSVNAAGTLLSGVRGVLSATVVAPGSDLTPAAKTINTLGHVVVHP
jgi:uncharacterized phage protein gp47/JayE